ncbi:MAG: tetratricopeptide repeat protein [Phycisphaerales bacterium]
MLARLLVLLSILLAPIGCHNRPAPRPAVAESRPQLFNGMGPHRRTVTTVSPLAQKYFDQGLNFAYAFNHDEAIRSFKEAARLDPDCAMAWWGVALCHGPHINNAAMTPEASAAAWAALERARKAAPKVSGLERELIDALGARYADPAPEDRAPLDAAYAAAMKGLWEKYPRDADIGCLYAEAMMDLRPWDLWTQDGSPQPGTEEIVATLERVLELNPMHPGANHLYIHAVEASPAPERAVASATRLRTLVPASGHMVHMPSHIDIRVGEWQKASEANRKAILADERYRELSPGQGFYRVYMAHNHHFLSFSCMMQGRRRDSLRAARELLASIPKDFKRQSPELVDPFLPILGDVQMRFGMWKDILKLPEPGTQFPIARAMRLFMRGVALAALGRIDEARAEQALFAAAVEAVPEQAVISINPARMVLSIAAHMLEGEIALAEGKLDEAVSALERGVAVEDELRYMEPPDWLHPVRHPLGAVLLRAGRYDEAEAVYREDLRRWPENGWSLFGLAEALRAQGNSEEAEAVDRRFKATWRWADTEINASCLCVKPRG